MILLALWYVSLARRVRTPNLDGTVTVTQLDGNITPTYGVKTYEECHSLLEQGH